MSKEGRLYQIAIHVGDLDAAVEFYRDLLGIELIHRFTNGPKMAFFDLGGPRLMIEETEVASAPGVFYLYTSDIESKIEKLAAAGITVLQQPQPIYKDEDGLFGDPGETEYLGFVEDPSGNMVGFMSRV